ncbi:predicted protein [Sclerotinia sclerotiorum 1980 UF-70]|uniref:Uncharacterized protein n=1 Tax=Sclerotinia sclerotiorum (strain ATCC 18683 / 1980 / Ss-1) TaxID=665079 RepID=A7EBZ0_SCLS1|nr:predicted protein [Sclerotinia sclerotiorum 1980 UF-70]EDN99968.1 predicted protein [Sclerotinia sclerotiorum 1980 UF-70]
MSLLNMRLDGHVMFNKNKNPDMQQYEEFSSATPSPTSRAILHVAEVVSRGRIGECAGSACNSGESKVIMILQMINGWNLYLAQRTPY